MKNLTPTTNGEQTLVHLEQDIKNHSLKYDTPYITLSFGMSLDGKIATYSGDSKYISCDESRQFVHELRNLHDGILVGINTVKIDHPSLTTRLSNKKGRDPHRIILDSMLRIPLDEPLLHLKSPAKTILITRSDADVDKVKALKQLGAEVVFIEDPSRPLNLKETLLNLKELGIGSILVEGGSTIHFSFIEQKLFQKLFATISPMILGGDHAKGAVGGKGFAFLKDASHVSFENIYQMGRDLILEVSPIEVANP